MKSQPNRNRRADLKAALKRARKDDVLTLEEVAIIWGTTKQRFVTVRNQMADFPQPFPGKGNTYEYPARAALEAMIAYETRHDNAARERAVRANAILGRNGKRAGIGVDAGSFSASELATYARLAAETEQRERDQGLYVPVAAMAALAGEVFSTISEFHRELSNKMDPHGLLPAEQRALIDSLADDFLLQLHRQMKDVLSPDAKPTGNRASARRTRRT